MSDIVSSSADGIFVCQMLASIFLTLAGIVTTAVNAPFKDDRWILRYSIPVVLLSWLIVPWLVYGIYAGAKWNYNQINWIERPPVVEPADQEHIKATHGVEK